MLAQVPRVLGPSPCCPVQPFPYLLQSLPLAEGTLQPPGPGLVPLSCSWPGTVRFCGRSQGSAVVSQDFFIFSRVACQAAVPAEMGADRPTRARR